MTLSRRPRKPVIVDLHFQLFIDAVHDLVVEPILKAGVFVFGAHLQNAPVGVRTQTRRGIADRAGQKACCRCDRAGRV